MTSFSPAPSGKHRCDFYVDLPKANWLATSMEERDKYRCRHDAVWQMGDKSDDALLCERCRKVFESNPGRLTLIQPWGVRSAADN